MRFRWRGGPGSLVQTRSGVDGEELHPGSGYSPFFPALGDFSLLFPDPKQNRRMPAAPVEK